jgi:hypothetical protein
MKSWPVLLSVILLSCGLSSFLSLDPASAAPRTVNIIVYGNDPCPHGAGDEIVVCGHRPESERYRIPKELRHKDDDPSEVSWASRVAGLEDAQRFTRPDSCSPVGSWGQTGCFAQMIQQWRAARRQAHSASAGVP